MLLPTAGDDSNEEVAVPTHQVEDGKLLSLAQVDHSVLDVDDFQFCAYSHSLVARGAARVIKERRFLIRKRFAAWINMKIKNMHTCRNG